MRQIAGAGRRHDWWVLVLRSTAKLWSSFIMLVTLTSLALGKVEEFGFVPFFAMTEEAMTSLNYSSRRS